MYAEVYGRRFALGWVLYDHDTVTPFGERMFAAPISTLSGTTQAQSLRRLRIETTGGSPIREARQCGDGDQIGRDCLSWEAQSFN